MLIQDFISKLITILYSLFILLGAFLIAFTAYNWGKKIDNNVLRARAFLNEPFLRDNWVLLLMIFIFNAIMPLTETLQLFIEKSNADLIKNLAQLGIIAGIVMLEYKWFNLLSPSEYHNRILDKESHIKKYQ
jgi:hypothetical protein